jgi:hypothetical protein
MNRTLLTAAACLMLAAAGFGLQTVIADTPTPRAVHTAPPATATPFNGPAAVPAPYTGPIALTVTPSATMVWSANLDPANFVDTFELVDPGHGFYLTGGTRYTIAHSYAKGSGAPGNAWEALRAGDVVAFPDGDYRVDLVSTPAQGAIGAEPVWFNDPAMRVMVTCESRGAGQPATNNVVIRLRIIPA